MRYLTIALICEVFAFVALMLGNATMDAIAARLGTGLTGYAAIGHSLAIVLCSTLAIVETVRKIRNAR